MWISPRQDLQCVEARQLCYPFTRGILVRSDNPTSVRAGFTSRRASAARATTLVEVGREDGAAFQCGHRGGAGDRCSRAPSFAKPYRSTMWIR